MKAIEKLRKSRAKTNEGNSLSDVYKKIKDWDAKALAGYARKIGIDDEVVDPLVKKRDAEELLSEILGFLFGDDVDRDLMKLGLI